MNQLKLNVKNFIYLTCCIVTVVLMSSFVLAESKTEQCINICPKPEASVKETFNGGVTFEWPNNGANSTSVEYVNVNNRSITGSLSTSGVQVTVTGLPAGTYEFKLRSSCGGGSYSEYIILDDVLIL
jgi:hypothetical protein